MIGAQDLADWLKTNGIVPATSKQADKIGFAVDGQIPNQPDRMVIIQATGGPGEQGERTRDVLSVQVRTRGKQGVGIDGEHLAWQVDDALMGAVPPLAIGPTRVISIQRAGGAPGFLERDSARRAHFACSYLLTCMRTTF